MIDRGYYLQLQNNLMLKSKQMTRVYHYTRYLRCSNFAAKTTTRRDIPKGRLRGQNSRGGQHQSYSHFSSGTSDGINEDCHYYDNYNKYLSPTSIKRQPSAIRKLQPLLAQNPDMISLGGGLPNPKLFPISSLSFDIQIPGNNNEKANTAMSTTTSTTVHFTPEELNGALHYSNTSGLPNYILIF